MYKSKFPGFTWFDIFHFGGLVFFWVLPNGKTQSESTSHAMQQSCPCTSLSRPHRLVAIKWITDNLCSFHPNLSDFQAAFTKSLNLNPLTTLSHPQSEALTLQTWD